ncbi:hypothetical protein SEA_NIEBRUSAYLOR_68 [Mycobacterium phage NiebruSaylor]|uniref:Uncharacterized protein n=8 Tax=Viruses TaxID=10239 RepID=Q856M2_BPMCO|nr:gp72 [Mycobacterium phage Corndog]YP_008409238.1 hypothetical protein PBI_CATDAWG_69 [Mycobacterium phage Catdawg]YP_008530633.1 hypothetical protein PBI_DYLAN_69 [Mycobacterium phage Dylan]YP_009014434.1 hypothetical protein CL96_gp071 [Mycobacterium phage Firecracker]YP_010097563.1 hypothetical protein KNU03_gp073 [Mycobacterium phage Ryadel]AII28313.1 hypothetical protein PBI_YUNGJAMAL_74 [Mycobacterium phage YungJamal]ALA48910.1 hypothetical protein ZAKHE101_68 [Mycobacterium phage Zak
MSLLDTLARNEAVRKLALEVAQRIGTVVADRLTALLPVIVTATVKAIEDSLRSALPGKLDLPDTATLVEQVRGLVNQLPDVDVPVVSDIFDLTEWLKGR